MGEDHLIASKTYGSNRQLKKELNMDMREAFRQKDLMCRKIAVRRSLKADHVRMCSHTTIQLGSVSFYDLAEIDMLKYPSMAR